MTEVKMRSRHDYIRETGKRISRGAWERLNRAYEVHIIPGKLKIVDYEKDEDGNNILSKPMLAPQTTNVLMRETTKCNRKVSMRNRYMEDGTRRRYLGKPAGATR